MVESTQYQARIELLQGILDMLILQALQLASDHRRRFQLVRAIGPVMEPEVQP